MVSGQRQGSKSISGDPLAYARGTLELVFNEFSLDGDDEFFDADVQGSTVSLTDWEDEWTTLTLRGELTINTDLTKEVFPEDEDDDLPGELVLAADCDRTHLREGHDTEITDFSAGTHGVSITVTSADYAGTFQVTPYLVRSESGDPSSNFRTMPGLALADGDSVTVEIDDIKEGGDSLLPSYFKSFSQSESSLFPDDAVYVVDKSDLDQPKLFVNSDHQGIRDAVQSGPRGYVGRVGQVYRDHIMTSAFTELVMWTAQDVDEDGTTPHDWQDVLLTIFGTRMYDVDDGETAGEKLYAEFNETQAMTSILNKTNMTLQSYYDVEEGMNKLVERLRR